MIAGVDFKTKTVELSDKKYKLQVWDTAGQERYNTIRKGFYRGAKVILYIYTYELMFIGGWLLLCRVARWHFRSTKCFIIVGPQLKYQVLKCQIANLHPY